MPDITDTQEAKDSELGFIVSVMYALGMAAGIYHIVKWWIGKI